MKINNSDLQYLIDHIFLPPKLPQMHDSDVHRKDSRLLDFVTHTSETFATTLAKPADVGTPHDLKVWSIIQKMLKTMATLYADGGIVRDELKVALEHMDIDGWFHSLQERWIFS
jgi:hypothetical protein